MQSAQSPFQTLPDDEKAQIAKILLKNQRKNGSKNNLNYQPVFKLMKDSTAANTAVEFFRVSSDGQRDGYSLEAQKEKACEYNKLHGLKSVKFWSVTESASKELDRNKFFEMMNFVAENGVKNIVFDKIDRACRGLRAAVMIEDFVEAGIRFHFTRDNLIVDKHSSPGEKLRFYLGVVLAKHYIDNLRIEIRKGLDQRWNDGYWNGTAPVGYKNIREEDGRARIEIDKKVAPFIKEAFELYATGNYSYKALEKYLKEKNVTVEKLVAHEMDEKMVKRREPCPITHKCIEKMVCNPFYYGARMRKGAVVRTGKEKHVPLISKELFDQCQKIKGVRAKNTKITHANEISKPLMNLLKCGECNHWITGEVHKKASGKIYVYYHCANQECTQRRIHVRQEEIFSQLNVAFEPFAKLTPKASAAFIENIKDNLKNLDLYAMAKVKEISEKKNSLDARCAELKTMREEGSLSLSEFEELLAQKMRMAEETEIELQAHVKVNQETFVAGLKIIELLRNAHEFMHLDGNDLGKARLVKMVLSNPILKDRNVEYHYGKPFDEIIELTTHRNWWT